jgi:hypothetical protein
MHLHHCRCFQEHLRMLLQILRASYLAPGGPGSIGNYVGAPVRSTGVSGRFACGFQTDLHFADVLEENRWVAKGEEKNDMEGVTDSMFGTLWMVERHREGVIVFRSGCVVCSRCFSKMSGVECDVGGWPCFIRCSSIPFVRLCGRLTQHLDLARGLVIINNIHFYMHKVALCPHRFQTRIAIFVRAG